MFFHTVFLLLCVFTYVWNTPSYTKEFNGRLFGFYNNDKNYRNAQYTCRDDFPATTDASYGALAFILDDATNNFILEQTGGQVWIGYDRYEHPNKEWFHVVLEVAGFSYTGINKDDYNWGYTKWRRSQPSDSDDGEWCAKMENDGGWDDKHNNANYKFVCMEYFVCDGKHEFLTDSCTKDGLCSTGNQCSCKDNYDPDTFCSTCINNYDIGTDCKYCKNNYDLSTNCKYCLYNYDEDSSCTTCKWGWKLDSQCLECENRALDPDENCKKCKYDNYAIDLNGDPSIQCTYCVWGYGLDTDCKSCVSDTLDPEVECSNCIHSHYADYVEEGSIDKSVEPDTACQACINEYLNEDASCLSCVNPHMEFAENCLKCSTNYLWNDTITDPMEHCNECINDGLSEDYLCLQCKTDRYNSSLPYETMCTGCIKRFGGYSCDTCKDDWYGFDCRLRCFNENEGESCGNGVCSKYGIEDDDVETATDVKCFCSEGYVGHNCEHECDLDDYEECSRKGNFKEECKVIFRYSGDLDFNVNNKYDNYLIGNNTGDCNTDDEDCFIGLQQIREISQSYDHLRLSVQAKKDNRFYKAECKDVFVFSEKDGFKVDYLECIGDDDLKEPFIENAWFSCKDDLEYPCSTNLPPSYGWWVTKDCEDPPFLEYDDYTLKLCGRTTEALEVDEDDKPELFCEKFIVHQQGGVDFNKSYSEYENGFGDCSSGDCFRGLKYLYSLSKASSFDDLKVRMEVEQAENSYEEICTISVGSPDDGYKLSISDCIGNLNKGSILSHNGKVFTAYDSETSYSQGFWNLESGVNKINPTGVIGRSGSTGMTTTTISGILSKFNWDICKTYPITQYDEQNSEDFFNSIGGLTKKVMVKRKYGTENFGCYNSVNSKYYDDYVEGFGSCEKETSDCFLGLEEIYQYTNPEVDGSPKTLMFNITLEDKNLYLACYNFYIESAENEYVAHLDKCEGSHELDEKYAYSMNNQPFSAIDHSVQKVNCGSKLKTGWWFNTADDGTGSCHELNVNPMGLLRKAMDDDYSIYYPGLTKNGEKSKAIRSFYIYLGGTFPEDNFESGDCVPFLVRNRKLDEENRIDFRKSWTNFVSGFGNCSLNANLGASNFGDECFLGLEDLSQLTKVPQYLNVDIITPSNVLRKEVFHCGTFQVDGFQDDYSIHFEHCAEDEEDIEVMGIYESIMDMNNNKFHTFDHHSNSNNIYKTNPSVNMGSYGGWYHSSESKENKFMPTLEKIYMDEFVDEDYPDAEIVAIRMSVCSTRKMTDEPQVNLLRSCRDNCYDTKLSTYSLETGEIMYEFASPNYVGDYHRVRMGPGEDYEISSGAESWFSTRVDRPMFFSETNFLYLKEGTSAMTVYDDCIAIEECGWELETPIRSAFVPENYIITFANQYPEETNSDYDYYELGGGGGDHFDEEINFEVRAWTYEYNSKSVEQDYPVFYKGKYYTGDTFEGRYDCKSSCSGIIGFKSLYVPDGYVVEIFENENFDEEGMSRKFIGEVSIPVIDGFFGRNNARSFRSDLSKVESIKIEIIEYYYDLAVVEEQDSQTIDQVEVINPTSSTKEVVFSHSYIESVTKNWDSSSFNIDSNSTELITTISETDEDTSSTGYSASVAYGKGAGLSADDDIYAIYGVGINAGVHTSISNTYIVGAVATVTAANENTDTEAKSTESFLNSFSKASVTTGTETVGENSWTNTKTFEYSCVALPYTKTTCTAIQETGVYTIPYYARQVWTYTDETKKYVYFNSELESQVSTEVSFTIDEKSTNSYCKYDFKGYKGDCYQAHVMISEESSNSIISNLKTVNQVEYENFGFVDAIESCYEDNGAIPTSVHSSMELYFLQDLCDFNPMILGVYYDPEKGELINFDKSEVDYTRLNFNNRNILDTITEKSYVVVTADGFFNFVPFENSNVANCTVCKKDTNFKLLGKLYQLSGLEGGANA